MNDDSDASQPRPALTGSRTVTRRELLQRGGLAGLAALLPAGVLAGCTAAGSPPLVRSTRAGAWTAFDDHEAAVVEEATARLIPGPEDDPSETGHPGAREAGVVYYIDAMLGALTVSPPRVYAGGPFSNRDGSPTDDMAHFLALTPAQLHGWTVRLTALRDQYRRGVLALDRLAGGDFVGASNGTRDGALSKDPDGFMTLLFSHAIEAMYSVPEYGGNRGLVGWSDISFPGDVQPRGFSDAEVSKSDGPDPYRPDATAERLLSLMGASSGR